MSSMIQEKNLPFTIEEYKNRLNAVRRVMYERSIDILIVNDPVELNYLLGYRSFGYDALPWQCLIITPTEEPVVVTRKLQAASYKNQTCVREIIFYGDNDDPLQVTIQVLKKMGISQKVIGIPFKTKYITPHHMSILRRELYSVENIVDGTDVITECRLVKSKQEIQYIEEAAHLTNQVMRDVTKKLKKFPSEKEIASVVMSDLLNLGSEHPGGLNPIIGIGKRSSFGHPTWENYRAKEQDVIFLEFSGCVYRYFAPIMRTLSVGEPTNLAKEFEEGSRYAVNQVIKNTYPGMTAEQVANLSKKSLEEAGVIEYSHVRTGYSVGIGFTSWRDGISIKQGEKTVLKENMVIHILPFLTDFETGVAVSETIVIEKDGARKITDVPQEILVI
ncbi:M24 family metallopeptidase [Alteribacillus iranensis]|uniref:Ectoine hydrolase n=1 Tax=Alteribacillus iranensis TaxID=930128 RepID=A0A1I2EB64_9BACI|nr:Xaa-Pro peptidase family protein [Alteribacillus iranensis]SFE89480.1 ectoine hydrolase [Alteribacillus iranensis]